MSTDMKRRLITRATVAQKRTSTPHMHRPACKRTPHDGSTASVGGALDDAANGARAAPGGRAAAPKLSAARVVGVVELEVPAEGARARRGRTAVAAVVRRPRGRRRADEARGSRDAVGEATGGRACAGLDEGDVGRLRTARGQRGTRGSVRHVRGVLQMCRAEGRSERGVRARDTPHQTV